MTMSCGEPSTCMVMSSSKLPSLSALRVTSSSWYPSTSICPVAGWTSMNWPKTVSGRRTWNTAGMRPRFASTTSYWWDVLVKIVPVSSVSTDSCRHAGSPSAQITSGSRVSRPVTSQNTDYNHNTDYMQSPQHFQPLSLAPHLIYIQRCHCSQFNSSVF